MTIPLKDFDSVAVESTAHLDRLRALIVGVLGDTADRCLAVLTAALLESPVAEVTLVGLERFVRSVPKPRELLDLLATAPRSVEVLLKLFAGSPYLTDILLREPSLLRQLTNPNSVGDLRSRQDFVESALAAVALSPESRWAALRRFQQGELLRIGVCDFLGLLDLRSVTNQLSLLADALVQASLRLIVSDDGDDHAPAELPKECGATLRVVSSEADFSSFVSNDEDSRRGASSHNGGLMPQPLHGFAVLAFGKLGGEELNYSSDIDLVFICDGDAAPFDSLAQKLNRALSDVTSHGFLYRVDLRLRPWGNAGPLVVTTAAYLDYLQTQGQLWEKQALLKTRVIAGDFALGQEFLKQCQPLIFAASAEAVRRSVWQAKKKIEQELQRRGRGWGEVKLGAGTIRDVEFVVQCLQLQHGGAVPEVRSINTLDGLVRLADFGFVQGDEFRELSSAYVFYRVIEHALQLKHSRQTHTLPSEPAELETLARRLDFFDARQLESHFQQHRAGVRRIFEKYVGEADALNYPKRERGGTLQNVSETQPSLWSGLPSPESLGTPALADAAGYKEAGVLCDHRLLDRLSPADPLIVDWQPLDVESGRITIAGFDQLGDLSMICGLLFVHGFDILSGQVETEEAAVELRATQKSSLRFLNSFAVRRRSLDARNTQGVRNTQTDSAMSSPTTAETSVEWTAFRTELLDLLKEAQSGRRREAQARLTRRVSEALTDARASGTVQSPVEIEFDNDSHPQTTVIRISAEDTSGFLYELTNALALLGVDVRQMVIQTVGSRVQDCLRVTDESGRKLLDARRQQELRAAIVLIQHFTDWLPQSPAPEAALLHFQQLLEYELREPDWLERLASLQRPEVLAALAKLLGVSDFFWEDFLRLQHANLFPVLTDVVGLQRQKMSAELSHELAEELAAATSFTERRARLNAFKDREMFRIDMRHLAGLAADFESFAAELTELAEVVLIVACGLVDAELRSKYGVPMTLEKREECRWCVAALGKLGGREIGFASDIELLFLYAADGMTDGRNAIPNAEFFQHFVELFQKVIQAKRAGIFRIDLRLRPYGRAGSLAVSCEQFCRYFAQDGAAWPFERQSLIKLRPIAGDVEFGEILVAKRDEFIFRDARWDAVPVRAMRERQVRQLVRAGTFHAKLSPGALVDVEYLVQLLQLAHGGQHPSLRTPNALEGLAELTRLGVIPNEAFEPLRSAYLFFRRLIDALRMARGSADDLTLPGANEDLFAGLARRLSCSTSQLASTVEQHSAAVRYWANTLGWPILPT